MKEGPLRNLLAFVCLLFAASAANAQSLPNFDMRARCMKLAMTPNVPTETVYDSCMAGEQAAYAELYHWWFEVGDGVRAKCLGSAGGSYANLQMCIDSQVNQ
jgi:hypothetical protein